MWNALEYPSYTPSVNRGVCNLAVSDYFGNLLHIKLKILPHKRELHFEMGCLKLLFRITFMICCCFTPGLGSKQQPLHVLVVHGSLPVICPSPLTGSAMRRWFEEESEEVCDHNRVEGVVWHCPSGALYKVLWSEDFGPVEISLDSPNIKLAIEGSVKTSVVLKSVILKSVFDALVLAFLSDMTCTVDKVLKTSCLL